MNRMIVVLLAVCLSACVDGQYLPRVVGGVVPDTAPYALAYQKRGQYGHTDYNQRKEDIIACGIPLERYDEHFSYVGGNRGGESDKQFMVRYRGFLKCLEDKGYDYLNENKCGPLKENRGICK